MKYAFTTLGMVIFGLIGLLIIILFNEITVSNEQDYYTLKDAAEAAMIESIDIPYYRLTGDFKISQEKFVESFSRRFTQTSTYGQGNYNIYFYEIDEAPPKMSIKIVDATNTYNIYNTFSVDVESTAVGIENELTAILDVYE